MHPLATPKTSLVSAKNATLLTYNGNENILQNDMGNAQIVDTRTGNIMGLSDGFVPVGIKEYGGIVYIASYNPATKESELGTIPSPVIDYTLSNFTEQVSDKQLTDIESNNDYIDSKILQEYIPIDENTVFRVGDQFIVELQLDGLFTKDWEDVLVNNKPLITKYNDQDNIEYGLYTISLYSKTISGQYINITSIIKNKQYYYDKDGNYTYSNYWFVPYKETSNIDLDTTYKKGKNLLTYPNIPSGRLYIKINVEKPSAFKATYNKNLKIFSPIYYLYDYE